MLHCLVVGEPLAGNGCSVEILERKRKLAMVHCCTLAYEILRENYMEALDGWIGAFLKDNVHDELMQHFRKNIVRGEQIAHCQRNIARGEQIERFLRGTVHDLFEQTLSDPPKTLEENVKVSTLNQSEVVCKDVVTITYQVELLVQYKSEVET